MSSIQAATPYFILGGRAQKAIPFYQSALGATVESLQRFGEVDKSCPEAQKDFVMHAELRVGKAVLMLSDGPGEAPVASAGSVSVALALTDVEEARRCFDALGVSGKVVQPLFDAPWGALFGVVNDQFGISWMFNCATK
jgi:PhnB protein